MYLGFAKHCVSVNIIIIDCIKLKIKVTSKSEILILVDLNKFSINQSIYRILILTHFIYVGSNL